MQAEICFFCFYKRIAKNMSQVSQFHQSSLLFQAAILG
jgi:hypothetical protein